jgi:hypothetical protein
LLSMSLWLVPLFCVFTKGTTKIAANVPRVKFGSAFAEF